MALDRSDDRGPRLVIREADAALTGTLREAKRAYVNASNEKCDRLMLSDAFVQRREVNVRVGDHNLDRISDVANARPRANNATVGRFLEVVG
jgi:hypothetical protein